MKSLYNSKIYISCFNYLSLSISLLLSLSLVFDEKLLFESRCMTKGKRYSGENFVAFLVELLVNKEETKKQTKERFFFARKFS